MNAIDDTGGTVRTTGGLPSSILTFLIADIRGYTRFTSEHGDEAAARLADSFAGLCEAVVLHHEGKLIELRGDEALAVFTSARQALRGAVALQQAFKRSAADDPALPLTVGMGLDAGEAVPVRGGYRGGALNLAARLCSIAGAGEILASEGVIHLARKTEGLSFVDRGRVTLKGLTAPVRVLQIAPEGELPDTLPPLQPILVTHPTNLPDDATPFIGREDEIAAIVRLLRNPSIRMVTLTGPGGTGKTRLALQVGNTLLYDFPDGVFFVPLAPLTDPAVIPSAIAEVLGIKEQAGRDQVETLIEALQAKQLLLVLDNFEHLLDGCEVVARLLDGCRDLHVLVTSRIPLHVSREQEHAVPPLSVPKPDGARDAASLSQYEAVALFIQRAKAARDTFTVTDENAPAVAEICTRLDGLPLAIELAAARIKLFTPQTLLPRLDNRLKLLTGGARDRPGRQQTLRQAIDWSHSLLTVEEQVLFARLSIFAGGCTFEAIEAICDPDGYVDVLEETTSLIDKSLLRQEGEDEPRISMLQTIREYAAEKLDEREERNAIAGTHAEYFQEMALQAEAEMRGPAQEEWIARIDREIDNLRAAMRRFLDTDAAVEAVRMAVALRFFWDGRGYWHEARRWLEEGLTQADRIPPGLRAHALQNLGRIMWMQGSSDRAVDVLEESLRVSQTEGDVDAQARVLHTLGGVARQQRQEERAVARYEESLRLYREADDQTGAAAVLGDLGIGAMDRRDTATARKRYEEALAIFRSVGDSTRVAWMLGNLAGVAFLEGNPSGAESLYEESLNLARKAGSKRWAAYALSNLGEVALQQGQLERSEERLRESLELAGQTGEQSLVLSVLATMAAVASAGGRILRAACLKGAESALRQSAGIRRPPADELESEATLRRVREALPEEEFIRIWERGQAMSVEEVIAYALHEPLQPADESRGLDRTE